MKALSLWQPWASLWLTDRKQYETRHWETPHRGWLVVHAAKRFPKDLDPELKELLEDEFGFNWDTLPTGAILGAVYLDNIIRTQSVTPNPEERICGNWLPFRYAWEATCAVSLLSPIPYKGQQGMFTIPDVVLEPLLKHIKAEYPDLAA